MSFLLKVNRIVDTQPILAGIYDYAPQNFFMHVINLNGFLEIFYFLRCVMH